MPERGSDRLAHWRKFLGGALLPLHLLHSRRAHQGLHLLHPSHRDHPGVDPGKPVSRGPVSAGHFLFICSFILILCWILIHKGPEYESNSDPDPKHCPAYKVDYLFYMFQYYIFCWGSSVKGRILNKYVGFGSGSDNWYGHHNLIIKFSQNTWHYFFCMTCVLLSF